MKTIINGRTCHVRSIEMKQKTVPEAHQGDNIGFNLENTDYNEARMFINKRLVFSY